MTILRAKYANAEGTAVEIDTDDTVSKLISEKDTPTLWEELLLSGIKIEPYTSPRKPTGSVGEEPPRVIE